MFKEELPRAVYEELDRRGLNGVPVLLAAHSDLSLSGRPERSWIVATRDNVTAVRETGETPSTPVVRGSYDPAQNDAQSVRGQQTRAVQSVWDRETHAQPRSL